MCHEIGFSNTTNITTVHLGHLAEIFPHNDRFMAELPEIEIKWEEHLRNNPLSDPRYRRAKANLTKQSKKELDNQRQPTMRLDTSKMIYTIGAGHQVHDSRGCESTSSTKNRLAHHGHVPVISPPMQNMPLTHQNSNNNPRTTMPGIFPEQQHTEQHTRQPRPAVQMAGNPARGSPCSFQKRE